MTNAAGRASQTTREGGLRGRSATPARAAAGTSPRQKQFPDFHHYTPHRPGGELNYPLGKKKASHGETWGASQYLGCCRARATRRKSERSFRRLGVARSLSLDSLRGVVPDRDQSIRLRAWPP